MRALFERYPEIQTARTLGPLLVILDDVWTEGLEGRLAHGQRGYFDNA